MVTASPPATATWQTLPSCPASTYIAATPSDTSVRAAAARVPTCTTKSASTTPRLTPTSTFALPWRTWADSQPEASFHFSKCRRERPRSCDSATDDAARARALAPIFLSRRILVRGGSVDHRDRDVQQSQVHRQLTAMVIPVVQHD